MYVLNIIFMLLGINPTFGILSSIESSFQKRGPVHCLVVTYAQIRHNSYDLSHLTIPLVVIDNINDTIGLNVASHECKNCKCEVLILHAHSIKL